VRNRRRSAVGGCNGSIVTTKRVDKSTGKVTTVHRAHVRRTGFASKSKVFESKRVAQDWLRNNDAESTLERATAGKTLKALIEDFVQAPPAKGTGTGQWVTSILDRAARRDEGRANFARRHHRRDRHPSVAAGVPQHAIRSQGHRR
jgi:hypothetical protein